MGLKRRLLTAFFFFFCLHIIFRLIFSHLYTYGKPKESLQYGYSSEKWEQEQQKRKETLRSFCSRTKNPQKMLKREVLKDGTLMSHLLVDDNHRAIYCYIPKISARSHFENLLVILENGKILGSRRLMMQKVRKNRCAKFHIGCTNWKRLLANLRGEVEAASVDEMPLKMVHGMTGRMLLYRRNLKDVDVMKKMETYTKFIVVRNPMERLISAYLNKIHHESATSIFQALVLPFVKKQRKNAHLKDITLEEFLSFVRTPTGRHNEHWISYEKLCHPCQVDYDFILKLETIEEDAERLLRFIGAPPNLRYPYRERRVITSLAEKYMKNITSEIIDGVIKYFENDFKMFGYDLPL